MTEVKKRIAPKAKSPSRAGKTLSATEKAEAITLWKTGAVTLDQLAKQFHRHRSCFTRLFSKEGAKKGETQEAHEKKVAEAVEHQVLGDAAISAQRIRETKEAHYKMAAGLARLTWTILSKATQENRAVSTTVNDMKALQAAAQVLKITREERYAVLGLNEKEVNDDTPLPDLLIQELTAQEIKAMHKQQQAINEDDLGFDMETMIPDPEEEDA